MKKSSTDNRSGNLEDVFRTGFGEAEVKPSANLWDRIDKQLDQQEQTSVYKRKATFYGRIVMLSLLLLFLAGGAWYYQYQKGQQTAPAAVAVQPQTEAASQAIALQSGAEAPDGAQAEQPATTGTVYPDKPAQNTLSPTPETAIETNETTASVPANAAPLPSATTTSTNTNSTTSAAPALAATQPIDKPIEPAKAGAAKKSSSTKRKDKAAAVAAIGAITLNSAKAKAGQGTIQTSSEGQATSQGATAPAKTGTAVTAGTPPADGDGQTLSQAQAPVQNALPTTPDPATTAVPAVAAAQPAEDTTAVAEKPLVVIPSTPEATAVAADFANQLPEIKGAWSLSFLYASYQFEHGLVVSNTIPGSASSSAYRQAAREFNELTKPSKSNRAELRAAYWLHERWRLEAGLSYSRNRAVTISTYEIYNYVMSTNGSMHLANQSSIIEPVLSGAHRDSVVAVLVPEFETSYQYDFLSAPIRVAYQSDTKGWHWFASGGLSAGKLLNSTVTSTRSAGRSSDTHHAFRNWNFAGLFSFGLGYQLDKNLSVSAGPDLSYSLNSLMDSRKAGIRQANPYTLGLAGGLTYTFR